MKTLTALAAAGIATLIAAPAFAEPMSYSCNDGSEITIDFESTPGAAVIALGEYDAVMLDGEGDASGGAFAFDQDSLVVDAGVATLAIEGDSEKTCEPM